MKSLACGLLVFWCGWAAAQGKEVQVGDITLEATSERVRAQQGKKVLWTNEELQFHPKSLKSIAGMVIVEGFSGRPLNRPQTLLIRPSTGEVVAHAGGSLLTWEENSFFFDDPSLTELMTQKTFRDITVLEVNEETGEKKRVVVPVEGVPQHCVEQTMTDWSPQVFQYTQKNGHDWLFSLETWNCRVQGTFDDRRGKFRIRFLYDRTTGKVTRGERYSFLPLFGYPLLLLPVLIMRRLGWLWAVLITSGVALAVRAATFNVWTFLFSLVVGFFIVMVVGVGLLIADASRPNGQKVPSWVWGSLLTILLIFATLWMRSELDCWGAWWC